MSIFRSIYPPSPLTPPPPDPGDQVFQWPPAQVQTWIDAVWANGSPAWGASFSTGTKPPPVGTSNPSVVWDHLIYAYMVENAFVYEIFAKVIREYVSGESLGPPDPDAANWLRLTEALFYRHPAATLSYAVESELRPDHRAVRRNAYYRMFGMDLNHGTPDQQPYAYHRPTAANRDFVSVLEELLRELWIANINRSNVSGAKPTDDARIGEAAQRLHDMLLLRRQGWNMAREELFAIATLGWFEYSLSFNSAIVRSLKAEGPSASTRLGKIAQLVKMPLPRYAHEYLQMAEPLSRLLQLVERHANWRTGQSALYTAPILEDVLTIIDNWSRATGRDLKSMRVQLARPPQEGWLAAAPR